MNYSAHELIALWNSFNKSVAESPSATVTGDIKLAEQKFFIIWNPTSSMPPTKQFMGRSSAEIVASKMANDNPGETFYVLEAHSGFLTPKQQQKIILK